MSTRDEILAAVRAALGPRPADAERIRREAAALLDDPASIRPALLAASRVDAFIARATAPKVSATVDRVGDAGAFPDAVGRYLAARGLSPTVALQPAQVLRAMDWSGFELHDGLAADEVAAVGVARWGVAETGSLVFHSDAETPVLTHFLALHHIVLLHADRILAYLEDYAQAVQGTKPPRNVNLVTGASGTTDIEGSLVLGAHGPRHLHIVIAGA